MSIPEHRLSGRTIDLDKEFWRTIQDAACQSNWIPDEYFVNDYVSDICHFLRTGEGIYDDRMTEAFNRIAEIPVTPAKAENSGSLNGSALIRAKAIARQGLVRPVNEKTVGVLDQWQRSIGEWHNPTILEIIGEFKEWYDAKRNQDT